MISLYTDLTTKTAYNRVAQEDLGLRALRFTFGMLTNRTWQNFMEAGREV